jgi:hypothetical protein
VCEEIDEKYNWINGADDPPINDEQFRRALDDLEERYER